MGAINFDLNKVRKVIIAVDCCLASDRVALSGDDALLTMYFCRKDLNAVSMAVDAGLGVVIVMPDDVQSSARLQSLLTKLGVAEFVCKCHGDDGMKAYGSNNASVLGECLCICGEVDDWEFVRMSGPVCCAADAAVDVIAASTYVSRHKSGEGCVRDVLEQILRAQGKWRNGLK